MISDYWFMAMFYIVGMCHGALFGRYTTMAEQRLQKTRESYECSDFNEHCDFVKTTTPGQYMCKQCGKTIYLRDEADEGV